MDMSTLSTDQIGAKELAIGLHVIMKEATNWERFKDHKMSADRKSITITLEDGREFTVSVYEKGKPFDVAMLLALMSLIPELSTLDQIHAALVGYVDLWRNS
jgi:hypothetical protein